MKIIAVDFDGCLCEAKWPDIGAPRQQVINELIRQQADGARLILWTCREGEQLKAAVMWCLNHGLKFDAVNDNLEENKTYFGNNSRKVYATEYWDDKNVCLYGYDTALSRISIDRRGVPKKNILPDHRTIQEYAKDQKGIRRFLRKIRFRAWMKLFDYTNGRL